LSNLTGKEPVATAFHQLGSVDFLRSGAYCNLNDIAKPFAKRLDNWMRLKGTQELFQAFRDDPSYGGAPPVITSTGGFQGHDEMDRGTLAHPDIALAFEKWCKSNDRIQPTYVYLVRAVGSNMCKIGISSNPSMRLRSMQVGSPLKLAICRTHPCENSAETEKVLHKAFEEYYSHGEWFKLGSNKAIELFDQIVADYPH